MRGLASFSCGSPPSDPHCVPGWKAVLGSRQTDGLDVVGVGDGTVQLHQRDVIVEGEGVVVGMGNDLLQVLLHYVASVLLLDVEAQVNFPSAGL